MCSLQQGCTNIPPRPPLPKKCSNHVKILGTKKVTRSNFHARIRRLVRDFRLPPRSRLKHRASELLRGGGIDNYLPTFRSNISVPSSSVKILRISWPLQVGPIYCPETSVRNCHYSLRNDPEERSSHQAPSKKVQLTVLPGAPGLCTATLSFV